MSRNTPGRVPVLEDAFAVNLAKLMRASRQYSSSTLTVTDGKTSGVVVLAPTTITLLIGGTIQQVKVVTVPCLKGRFRRLLKCPRAHEGNFQTLYYRGGELACRHCHRLRYQITLASSAADRVRLGRFKLLAKMGGADGAVAIPKRRPYAWKRKYQRMAIRLAGLTGAHYGSIRDWLERVGKGSSAS